MLSYFVHARLFHTFFFYKFVASKNFPPKSLMSRVASNRLAIKHPTNLFSQNGTPPGNVFVHVASSVGNLKFLEDNLLIPSSGVKNPKRSPETSVKNYHYSLRNNPDESSSHLLRGGSLKSRLKFRFPMHINLTLFNSSLEMPKQSFQLLKICLDMRQSPCTQNFIISPRKLPVNSSHRDGLPCTVSSSVRSQNNGAGNNFA